MKLVFTMQLLGDKLYNLLDNTKIKKISELKNLSVHAVSAIGNNARFFDQLESYDLKVVKHSFVDHYYFKAQDFIFNDDLPIVITYKDAVKCIELFSSDDSTAGSSKNTNITIEGTNANISMIDIAKNMWIYPVTAKLAEEFSKKVLFKLKIKTPLKSRMDSVLDSWNEKKKD